MKKILSISGLVLLLTVLTILGYMRYADKNTQENLYVNQENVAVVKEESAKTVEFYEENAPLLPGTPILFYSEQIDENTNKLWVKRGSHPPEGLITLNAYFQQFDSSTSNENHNPKDDAKRYVIIAQQSVGHYVYEYDLTNNSVNLIKGGRGYLPFNLTKKWLEKENLLIVGMEDGGTYTFDLDAGTTKKLSGTEHRKLLGKEGENYIELRKMAEDSCFMTGEVPSIYAVKEARSGKILKEFGGEEMHTSNITTSPDDNEVLFSVSRIKQNCDDMREENYYLMNLNQPGEAKKNDNFKKVLEEWYPKDYRIVRDTNRRKIDIFSKKENPIFTLNGYEFVGLMYEDNASTAIGPNGDNSKFSEINPKPLPIFTSPLPPNFPPPPPMPDPMQFLPKPR